MWFVRMTARSSISGLVSEKVFSIPGDTAHELLYDGEFKWKHMEAMLDSGSLLKLEIDYKAVGA